MKVWLLPYILGILAIVSGNLAFLISVFEGNVESCIPYFEGCASISASGRHGLAAILFKLITLPVLALLSIYWLISWAYIREIDSTKPLQVKLMLIAGIIGSFFGILYSAFLGSEGDIYQLLRRFGIYFFFLGTYIAQILEVRLLSSIKRLEEFFYLKGLKLLILLVGLIILISTPFYGFVTNDDWLENILEWNITFLVFLYFIFSALLWRKAGLQTNFKEESF